MTDAKYQYATPERAGELDRMTVGELQGFAKKYDLAEGGTRDELEGRIFVYENKTPPDERKNVAPVPATGPATIRVRVKKDGREVTINEGDFDPEIYTRLGKASSRSAELSDYTAVELRAAAKEAGLETDGTKAELVKRILAHERALARV